MLNFPFIFIIPDKCETLEIARGSRPGRGVQLLHFSRREEGRATLFCSTLFPSGSLMTRANRPRNDLRNFRNDVGTTRRFVEGNDVVITAPIAASIVSRGTLHRLIIPLFYY